MKVISLGSSCYIRANMDNNGIKEETNFFDWLISDFKTVLLVLNNINNPNFLNSSDFTDQWIYQQCNSWYDKYHKIENKNFKMITIHDFPSNIPYSNYMNEFIDKYKRRLVRLKESISNTKENIHFIHGIDYQFLDGYFPTLDDINTFFNIINSINPNNRIYLHIVLPPKYENINLNNLVINDKIFVYNLKIENNKQVLVDWRNFDYNYNIVFDNIKKIG